MIYKEWITNSKTIQIAIVKLYIFFNRDIVGMKYSLKVSISHLKPVRVGDFLRFFKEVHDEGNYLDF